MSSEPLTIRPAKLADLGGIVSFTRTARRQLARWAPVYFNPAASADELHAAFLEFMIVSDDIAAKAVVDDEVVVGFFVELPLAGGARTWVDDLCVADESLWPATVDALNNAVAAPWVTCVSSRDTQRTQAMTERGQQVVSSYWARATHDVESIAPAGFDPVDFDATHAPPHTFGNGPADPRLEGALIVGSEAGFAIGTPSGTPPIYDPGGPTAVVDQVRGPKRAEVLQAALKAAKHRGDAQVIVVCGPKDAELIAIVTAAGFSRVVDLIGT